MKFKLNTIKLKEALNIVNHATANITTTPILENILLKVNFNNVVFTSNNLEMAIEYVISDVEISSEWAFCIPWKLFTSYISLLTDDDVEISKVKSDSIEVKTESWIFKIKWVESSEFPLIPNLREEQHFYMNWKNLKKAIEKTLFSSAEWAIRPTLAWIFLNINWKEARFASTDSFRLSEYKTFLDEEISWNLSQIIPWKTSSELKNMLKDDENVKLVFGENQIAFVFWNTKFYSRLLNGKFPDYQNFFPNSYSTKAEINRFDLMSALKKVNLISKENNYSIKMSFSAESWILLETSETQIWETEVRLVWSVEWEENIIWINSTYFLEALWVMETTHISIRFESPLAPVLITPLIDPDKKNDYWDFRHIIMPLKI